MISPGSRPAGCCDGDSYVVSGQKVWSTWAQWADYGYLLARTEPVLGAGGITAFILDMRSAGVDVRPLREMTGTTDFNEVFFDEVRIPWPTSSAHPARVGRWRGPAWWKSAPGSGGGGGGGDPCSDSSRWLINRTPSARSRTAPSANTSASLIARARIQRHLGQRMATKAARGQISAADAPISKIWFSELNLEIAETALALLGARSMLVEGDELSEDDGRWQDSFLYARAWTIAGGTNEIMRNMIAERGLGLPREPKGKL